MEDNDAVPIEKADQSDDISAKINTLPKALRLSLSWPRVINAMNSNQNLIDKPVSEIKNFLYSRLSFRTENWIASIEPIFETYNTIIWFKTVKWIHLNFGDIGVKALFHKIFESLEPGGLFIYDATNWQSYKKKKTMNKDIKTNFNKIEFKPSQFDQYLKQAVGFEFVEALKSSSEGKKSSKPILVYSKPLS